MIKKKKKSYTNPFRFSPNPFSSSFLLSFIKKKLILSHSSSALLSYFLSISLYSMTYIFPLPNKKKKFFIPNLSSFSFFSLSSPSSVFFSFLSKVSPAVVAPLLLILPPPWGGSLYYRCAFCMSPFLWLRPA